MYNLHKQIDKKMSEKALTQYAHLLDNYTHSKKNKLEEKSMKSTGIVRNIDNLGRITLPIELRRNLNMECGDPLEIYTQGETIILKKHENSCVFCGNTKKVNAFKGKNICDDCKSDLS